MSKFKIGDRVRCLVQGSGVAKAVNKGALGTVTDIDTKFPTTVCQVDFGPGVGKHWGQEREFELAGPEFTVGDRVRKKMDAAGRIPGGTEAIVAWVGADGRGQVIDLEIKMPGGGYVPGMGHRTSVTSAAEYWELVTSASAAPRPASSAKKLTNDGLDHCRWCGGLTEIVNTGFTTRKVMRRCARCEPTRAGRI
jgi:hypothetical protein